MLICDALMFRCAINPGSTVETITLINDGQQQAKGDRRERIPSRVLLPSRHRQVDTNDPDCELWQVNNQLNRRLG